MTWLDRRTHRTALATLASVLGCPEASLAAAIAAEPFRVTGAQDEDPYRDLPRAVLGRLGVDAREATGRAEGALFFHGTRLVDRASVLGEGLLPLSTRIEAIWEMLGPLAAPETDAATWSDLRAWVEAGGGGHDGLLYRKKTTERIHDGPFTVLVRDLLIRPVEMGWHDYLGCPEIIQDICRCHEARLGPGIDLERRFKAATEPFIVTVRRTGIGEEAIETAIWFIRTGLLGLPLCIARTGGSGRPQGEIPASDIVAVDPVRAPGD